ncbi:MAG: hypothetical protein J6A01_04990 [Proteobacteria bacterium]|nr:hypothetical protein [Pseudomonadota bacterium]
MSTNYNKVTIIPLEGGLKGVTAQYNPKEISFSKSVQWQDEEGSGMDYPTVYFTQGQAISISVELFFDHYESGEDVRVEASNVLAMCNIIDHDKKPRPPMVKLVWGGVNPAFHGNDFIGVIESASVKYTMFKDSVPVRASITVQIKQADSVQSKITTYERDENGELKAKSTTTTQFSASETSVDTSNLSVADVSNNPAYQQAIVAAGGDPADKSTWPSTIKVSGASETGSWSKDEEGGDEG